MIHIHWCGLELTGGEGEHLRASRPSGGSVVWGSASGGPEDPRDRLPPRCQLGQTEQALPGQTEVRRQRHIHRFSKCPWLQEYWLMLCMHLNEICVCVCSSRRWQDCNSKWQKFVSDEKALEEWLNLAGSTLKLAESEPAAHRHLRVTHTNMATNAADVPPSKSKLSFFAFCPDWSMMTCDRTKQDVTHADMIWRSWHQNVSLHFISGPSVAKDHIISCLMSSVTKS